MVSADLPAEWIAELRGAIHPQGLGWGYDEPISVSFPDSEWRVLISESQFRVIVQGARPDDLAGFVNDVVEVVRGLLDSIGFHLGCVLTPEFTGGFGSPNVVIVRQVGWPELVDRGATASLHVEADDLDPFVRAGLTEPLVRHALSDISMAIDRPIDTAFYAHRAVESVRHYFVGDEPMADRAPSWRRMRETLGFTREQLDPLTRASIPRRHGAQIPIAASDRLNHARLAREVVAAFVAHVASRAAAGDPDAGQ